MSRKHNKTKTIIVLWTMTPTPPLQNRHLLQNSIIGLDALHNAENKWI